MDGAELRRLLSLDASAPFLLLSAAPFCGRVAALICPVSSSISGLQPWEPGIRSNSKALTCLRSPLIIKESSTDN